MPAVAAFFTRISLLLRSAFPLCFLLANVSAALLIFFSDRLDERTALGATFGLLWCGGLIFLHCTYLPRARELAGPANGTHDFPSPYERSHPLMRQVIDFNFLAYFLTLIAATGFWLHAP